MVIASIHDGSVLDEVEQEDKDHESWSDDGPAEQPIHINLVTNHQFNTIVHFLGSKNPANGNGLEERAPEQRHSRSGIKIHQLEEVDATICAHWNA